MFHKKQPMFLKKLFIHTCIDYGEYMENIEYYTFNMVNIHVFLVDVFDPNLRTTQLFCF